MLVNCPGILQGTHVCEPASNRDLGRFGSTSIEDPRFLRGRGQFVVDLKREGMLHAAILRSRIGHGRVAAVNASAALAIAGVRAVITAKDIEVVAQKPGIFISYARSDSSALAEELVVGLEDAGFRPFLDRHDIAAAEDWEARLGALILGADTVVFILSPAAARSERCAWEVAHLRLRHRRPLDRDQPFAQFGGALVLGTSRQNGR